MKTANYSMHFDTKIKAKPNKMLRASFDEADMIMANPNRKTYANIEEMNAAMDAEDAEDGELTATTEYVYA